MAQKPERLNSYYFDLFAATLKSNIPEYDKAEKRVITPSGMAEIVAFGSPIGRAPSSPAQVGEWSDYHYFERSLSVHSVEPEVESVVRMLAKRLADSVDDLVIESLVHGRPICYDLFKLSDGSPNLQTFYCLKGNESTPDDPTDSSTGWFAYKVRFTVSIRH